MLDKLVPKISAYAVFYWDGFLGICFVLVGLAAFFQNVPHATGLLLSGLGMSGFSMARRKVHHIGNVRRSCNGYWPDIRKQAYPSIRLLPVLAGIFMGLFSLRSARFRDDGTMGTQDSVPESHPFSGSPRFCKLP